MSVKKQYKKKKNWYNAEESVLCDIWGTKIDILRGARKNSHILEEIRLELDSICGIKAIKDEIKTKIHNLKTRYRQSLHILLNKLNNMLMKIIYNS